MGNNTDYRYILSTLIIDDEATTKDLAKKVDLPEWRVEDYLLDLEVRMKVREYKKGYWRKIERNITS